jgi:hypothetical protein
VDRYSIRGAADSNSRASVLDASQVVSYADNLQLTCPVGVETGAPTNASTYKAVVANFRGPNPFPVDVIVDKAGIIRYVTHQYDPDAMDELIQRLLAE